jgi:hypothetical protein
VRRSQPSKNATDIGVESYVHFYPLVSIDVTRRIGGLCHKLSGEIRCQK